jgi:hypothetical protein
VAGSYPQLPPTVGSSNRPGRTSLDDPLLEGSKACENPILTMDVVASI